MISPAPRLLLLAALAGFPAALLYAAAPALAPVAALPALAAVAIAALDATLCARCFGGLSVALPEVMRLTVAREGKLALTLSNASSSPRRVEVALAWTPELACPVESATTSVASDSSALVEFPCTPRTRGRFVLDAVYLRVRSSLGLWQMRRAFPAQCEVRAYPNLMAERTNLAALFLNRGAAGAHAQRQVGKGKEFEKLREYAPGDSYEDIYWKATAKRARPVTKEFQIERTQEIYVIIDASRLSGRPVQDDSAHLGNTSPVNQLERFVTASLVLGLVAEKQGDLFGLTVFSDQVDAFVRAKAGQAHHRSLRDALYTLQPKRVNPDFSEVFTFLRTRLRRRALLFFLTNLDDPVLAESFTRDVQILSRQHLVMVNTLNLPGIAPVFSQPEVDSVDGVYQQLAGHLHWHKLRECQRVLRQYNVTLSMLDSAAACPQLVTQYMNVKRRQAL
jgi:uncharacterized protein (DUF58 family)